MRYNGDLYINCAVQLESEPALPNKKIYISANLTGTPAGSKSRIDMKIFAEGEICETFL